MSYRFEKLIVWQKAMDFCVRIYDVCKDFPKEEIYGLSSQLKRASTSIPLNIAEESACKTKKEFIRFLYVALRSEYEVVTIILLVYRLNYISGSTKENLEKDIFEIGKLLQALINSLEKNLTTNN
jgi:four helix bundle protein